MTTITFSKTQAKEKIAGLVDKFESLSSRVIKNYNEANTRKDFILPLFHALGWDVYNDFVDNEVVEEETSISGRIDYSFRINNITKFILEAKAIPEDLDKDKWAYQAIEYGWNKGIPWVVLTDFEGLKVFNSEWKVDKPRANIDLSYKEYLEKFDKLWLLSKESFETDELDKLLSEFGITAKRINVNKKLAEDLVEWRDILTKNLKAWNDKINLHDIGEAVQRILDRLIFIRVVEDRNIEDKVLWQVFKKWELNSYEPNNFIKALTPLFQQFDKKYNSNLFQKHLCENLDTEGDPFQKIIPDFYADKEAGVKYRFDAIDADVLGNIYEQYLGTVQQREGDKSKRKKQGIYYTPTYIVDYIVQNTLGKLLEETTSLAEKEKIKILDPACGSGSFLIKAFEVVDEHFRKIRNDKTNDHNQNALRKYRILTENIYGVDLDEQAIEIARLNLLLKALVPKHKLPLLTEHMKTGNSLIPDKKVNDKAFNWQEEFLEVFKGENSGFDVIVGNPPYIQLSMGKKLTPVLKEYLIKKYESSMGRLNTFGFFIKLGIDLLKDGGYLGFIIPNTILTQDYYEELRKMILNSCAIKNIVSFEELPFKEAVVENVILIIQKNQSREKRVNNKIRVYKVNGKLDFSKSKNVVQKRFLNSYKKTFNLNLDEDMLLLKKKIEKSTKPLREFLHVNQAIALKHDRNKWVTKKKIGLNLKPLLLGGKNIKRYSLFWDRTYLKYDLKGIHSCKREDIFLTKEKIFFRRVADRLIATLDKNKFYGLHTLVVMNLKCLNKYSLRYFLALFNSKLMSYYYKKSFASTKTVFSEIGARQVKKLPIKIVDFSKTKEKKKHDLLVRLAQKMLDFNKKLQSASENTNRWHKLKTEIEKLDKKIDKEVFKLYNLTPEEVEIVEGREHVK